LEGDSLHVAIVLKSSIDNNSYFASMLNDWKSFSGLFSSFLVSRVRKANNIVAHSLAKFVLVALLMIVKKGEW